MKKLCIAALAGLALAGPALAEEVRVYNNGYSDNWAGIFSAYDADKSGDLDGPEWRALKDDIKHHQEKYMALDTNDDGDISDDEIDAAMKSSWGKGRRANLAPSEWTVTTTTTEWTPTGWTAYDMDHDGMIDDVEWGRLYSTWQPSTYDTWSMWDLNGDRKLSEGELRLARRHYQNW